MARQRAAFAHPTRRLLILIPGSYAFTWGFIALGVTGLVSLGVGFFAWLADDPAWQTMAFTTLTMAQMGNALAVRSERFPLWKIGLFSNRLILGAVLLTLGLQLAVVYLPFLQEIFNTQALTLADLAISLGCSLLVYLGVEVYKLAVTRASRAR